MKELELKYGCNPNQKPSRMDQNFQSRFFQEDLDTLIFWMHLTDGSWYAI